MNITPDVITDLLPIYLAGEASPGTRALLEEYLRDNPAFAKEVREHAERSTALLTATTAKRRRSSGCAASTGIEATSSPCPSRSR
jgi:anti-sigma factor RsiW